MPTTPHSTADRLISTRSSPRLTDYMFHSVFTQHQFRHSYICDVYDTPYMIRQLFPQVFSYITYPCAHFHPHASSRQRILSVPSHLVTRASNLSLVSSPACSTLPQCHLFTHVLTLQCLSPGHHSIIQLQMFSPSQVVPFSNY